MHSGKANKRGRCRKGLVTVFVIRVFTMGCILPCLFLPDGGTETTVPLLSWKSEKLDIKRIDLFVHERVCFCVCSMFHSHDADTYVCKMQNHLRDMLQSRTPTKKMPSEIKFKDGQFSNKMPSLHLQKLVSLGMNLLYKNGHHLLKQSNERIWTYKDLCHNRE